ncbi:MAG: hypothetical protein IH595_03580 [Bacteroidales bacterium]|nr:hypothetical protein [Bacteroidales bacterium]
MKKLFSVTILILFLTVTLSAQDTLSKNFLDDFHFRNLGPFRTGSWISCITVPVQNGKPLPHTFYVGSRNGGVWKTVNNGTTFYPIFDSVGSGSIGAIAIAPSNPDIVWVGTGESFNARYSYGGKGIYKSTNAGKTWQFMGLKDSQHIAAIQIDPKNPNVVYVAVMGHLFTPNEERGIFKTVDGGKTWKKVLFVDENTGFIDLKMNPKNPNVLYAAAYEKYRLPWSFIATGEHSGIYKTSDAGAHWTRLNNGLPKGKMGRIGLTIFPKNPNIVYAIIEVQKYLHEKEEEKTINRHLKPVGEGIWSDIYKSMDGGVHWVKTNADTVNISDKAPYSFNKIFVDPEDENRIYVLAETMPYSNDGGKTWHNLTYGNTKFLPNVFGDFRCMWIDPSDPNHMMIGSDGGLYISYDKGKTADHYFNIPLGEVYNISCDMQKPYNVYCGLQDHEVWKGPSNSWEGEISEPDWALVGKWDGMYCPVDTSNSRWFYATTQFGAHIRVDQAKSIRTDIAPKAPAGQPAYRFCWDTPLIISPHDSKMLFTGGQMLLQSTDRGDHWKALTPDLTTNNPEKINGKGFMHYCTITTISESPVKAGLIWVGTDDGRVWLIRDYGKEMEEMTQKIAAVGGPVNHWVSRVFASSFSANTAYVVKNGFKRDDFKPYVFKTTDGGQTWQNISKGLPDSPVNVIIEDHINPNLLFVGDDRGIYFSLNCGESWIPLKGNMPVVPVKDLTIQPRENDLIAGTYGRGLWITPISVLQQMTPEILKEKMHLFNIQPKPARNYSQAAFWGNSRLMGDRHIFTPNEPNGLRINYYLNEPVKDSLLVKIYNMDGKEMANLKAPVSKGLHHVQWDTGNTKPGNYRVVLKSATDSISKDATVEPALVYSVLNYKPQK